MTYLRGNRFRLFTDGDLDRVLEARIQDLRKEVQSGSENYILNVNETNYVNYLVEKYTLENIALDFEGVFVSSYEMDVPAERFPKFLFDEMPGKSYKKDVVRYHIPLSGDQSLLRYLPNPRMHWTPEVVIESGCLCFDVINFYNDPDTIKQEADGAIGNLKTQFDYIARQVDAFNSQVRDRAIKAYRSRRKHLLDKSDLLASLGVPIRKRNDFPETFAIPDPERRKKVHIKKPSVHEKGFKPDPTLDSSVYEDILRVIYDVGRQFERMPSTYVNKSEEDLRDHLLLVLEPRFEGSATGETFNKTGKTDILLRHEGANVFIAECKFWRGAKAFHKAIDQLLDYLTWRDSKAALVIFVKNKGFSSVIRTVEEETPKHPNFLGFIGRREESWLDYRYHLKDDPNREVRLAILLFHIPDE